MSLGILQLPPSCQLQSSYKKLVQTLQASIHTLSLNEVE